MLSPKRVKYRKIQKGNLGGKATKGSEVSFGQYGLQALAPGRITAQQIEAARVAMTRHIKRGGRIWIRWYGDDNGGSGSRDEYGINNVRIVPRGPEGTIISFR